MVDSTTASGAANRPIVFDDEWYASHQCMTIQEVMALAKTSRTTINRLVDAGELEAVQFGKIRKIKAASVHRYMERSGGHDAAAPRRSMPRRFGPGKQGQRGEAT